MTINPESRIRNPESSPKESQRSSKKRMTIHKEGYGIISFLILSLVVVFSVVYFLYFHIPLVWGITLAASFLLFFFILCFFRKPARTQIYNNKFIFAPADGKIVVIEETTEDEYFKDKRIQVSIFMSVWNVHINWHPVSGIISYYQYHKGKYLLARHPKSSSENERNTIVVKINDHFSILIRQIAGIVARRIVSYTKTDMSVRQGDELGFIKFGSRVDLFLPLNTEIAVQIGQKVKGKQTVIGILPE